MVTFYVFAILAGIASAVAPGQNAQVSASIKNPILAGVASLSFGVATIILLMLVTGAVGMPSKAQLIQVPWWAWYGGVLSAVLALAQLYVSKRIGAAPFLGIIVTTGVATSILLDHFGLVGFKPHAANLGRILGGTLMIAGVTLVARF